MNRKTKLLMLMSVILVIVIGISGCSPKENEEAQEIESPDNNQSIDQTDNVEEIDAIKLPAFKLKDLEGKDVSSDIFNENKMTIVTIWQSTCGACMGELEALNVIYDEYKDKEVNVIGISVDNVETMGDDGVKKVAEILELKFINIIADNEYLMELANYVQGTPTAFIVGEDGEILMEPRVGSLGKEGDIEAFRDIIKGIIKE